jgi:hypothetical protein
MEKNISAYGVLMTELEDRDNSKESEVNCSTILKCIFKMQNERAWDGVISLGIGTSGGVLWARK